MEHTNNLLRNGFGAAQGKQMWAHPPARKLESMEERMFRDLFYVLEPLQKRRTMGLDQINDPPGLTSVQEQMLSEEYEYLKDSAFPASNASCGQRIFQEKGNVFIFVTHHCFFFQKSVEALFEAM